MIASTTQSPQTTPALSMSQPRLLLSLEGLVVFIGAIALYSQQSGEWLAFIVLLLAPDLSMIGYLVNPRIGATAYNLIHTYALPITLGVASLLGGWPLGVSLALVWLAHIGMDRTVGYGLKYASNFKDTHLQHV